MSSYRLYTGSCVDRKQVISTLIQMIHDSTRYSCNWNAFHCIISGSLPLSFSSLT